VTGPVCPRGPTPPPGVGRACVPELFATTCSLSYPDRSRTGHTGLEHWSSKHGHGSTEFPCQMVAFICQKNGACGRSPARKGACGAMFSGLSLMERLVPSLITTATGYLPSLLSEPTTVPLRSFYSTRLRPCNQTSSPTRQPLHVFLWSFQADRLHSSLQLSSVRQRAHT
jgi:hypothetical protein